jgi:hypothetical protein
MMINNWTDNRFREPLDSTERAFNQVFRANGVTIQEKKVRCTPPHGPLCRIVACGDKAAVGITNVDHRIGRPEVAGRRFGRSIVRHYDREILGGLQA